MFLEPTTEHEVDRLIDSLKNKKSSGYDQINNLLLKDLKDEILKPLTKIFNQSLSDGVFPDRMKSADVVPLYKSKLRTDKKQLQTNLSSTDTLQDLGEISVQENLLVFGKYKSNL